MLVKARLQSVCKRKQHQRHHSHCQNRVRNQDREVNRPRPSLSGKMYRAYMRMVIEVADQKDARRGKRGNHTGPMQPYFLARDEQPAGGNQDCAGAVQRGIQGGEEAIVCHQCPLSVEWIYLPWLSPSFMNAPRSAS